MTEGLFPASDAAEQYKAKAEQDALHCAETCLGALNSIGECYANFDWKYANAVSAAVALLAERGWDAESGIENYSRPSANGGSSTHPYLRAFTPARSREKLAESRRALDVILASAKAHWRRRWSLSEWMSDQKGYYSSGLDEQILKDAQLAFKKQDFALARQLFDRAFAEREAMLAQLEVKSKAQSA